MSAAQINRTVREWSSRLRRDPLASTVIRSLRDRSGDIWRETFELLREESLEYRNSIDDEFTRESQQHCGELLNAIVAITSVHSRKSIAHTLDFVRRHAEWRARHGVPLIASLHAYRLAHRTYARIARGSLLHHSAPEKALLSLAILSDFWIEFFDFISAVFSEAHAVEERLMAAQSSRTYARLIDDLLKGRLPQDGEAERLCKVCGIRPDAPKAIVVARPHSSGDGTRLDLEVALRSLVRLIEQALASKIFGKLLEVQKDDVMAIVCCESNPSQSAREVFRRTVVARHAPDGTAWRVGISRDTSEIARLPDALEEARLALEFASARNPIVRFGEIDLLELLVRHPHPAAMRLVPDWAHALYDADSGNSKELARTIRAFAECSLNVKQTARWLEVHTNTVYFRLNRIHRVTGVDPRTYVGASRLVTALRLLEVHHLAEAQRSMSFSEPSG